MNFIPIYRDLIQKFSYYPGKPMGSFMASSAPFDFVADQLRSFSGMSLDLRRNRGYLKDACETVLPLVYEWGLPSAQHPEGACLIPLYIPSFKKMLEQYAAVGVRPQLFCEDDWTRYLDIIHDELPAGTKIMFEYGDPKTIKEKLGKKFILSGLFSVSAVKSDTPTVSVRQ